MKTKKLLLTILLVSFFCSYTFGQDDQKISTVCLSVILPTNIDGLSESHLSKLESKIIEAVTNNGISATGLTQNFVIYPKFEIYNTRQTQGGMMSLTVLNCNLSLIIKQVNSNIIFSAYSKSMESSGYSKDEALNDAINKIDPSDPKIEAFIKKAKDKIVDYYKANCDLVIKKAETERIEKRYESSLSILLTIPEEATACYDKAQAVSKVVFKEYMIAFCNQHLLNARALAAAKEFDSALEELCLIDMNGTCAVGANKLLNSIAKEIDDDKKKYWKFLLQVHADEVSLERERIRARAMRSIAIAYLKSRPRNVNYITIIK
ncbi:MAG: hypothetical protein KGL19_14425 [Bacteroidota bacterium]|nr:hypothetical protein [Bacteroidota bacterium]